MTRRKKKMIYKYNTEILHNKYRLKKKIINSLSSFISISNYPRKSKCPCILTCFAKKNAICNFSMPNQSSIRVCISHSFIPRLAAVSCFIRARAPFLARRLRCNLPAAFGLHLSAAHLWARVCTRIPAGI